MVLGLAEVYWFMGFGARVSVTLMYSIFLVEDESQGENLVWQKAMPPRGFYKDSLCKRLCPP